MTNQVFTQGIALLNRIFPKLGIEAKLYWELLNDLDGQLFLMAIQKIIKTIPELYRGTNIIAMIRLRAEEMRVEIFKNTSLRITAETEKERIERWEKEAVPMPQECKDKLEGWGLAEKF